MKLITRYLLKELSGPFFMGLMLFTFVLLFGQFLELTDLVVNQGVNLIDLAVFVLLGIPETFQLIVPMATVLATLMAYGRLAHDNEIVVLRTAGVPVHTLVIPTLIGGLFLSILLIGFTEYAAPRLAEIRDQRFAEMKQPNPIELMQARTYQDFGPFTIYAEGVDGRDLRGVYIEDHRDPQTRIIQGATGTWSRTGDRYQLKLRNGSVHQAGEESSEYRILTFQTQTLQFEPDKTTGSGGLDPVHAITTLWKNYNEALSRYNKLQQQDSSGKTLNRARQQAVNSGLTFHQSLAFPMACFFLILTAAPIGMLAQQEGKSMGFLVSLGIIFTYYIMMILAEPLALNGWVGPGVATWSANVLFGLTGLGLFGWITLSGR